MNDEPRPKETKHDKFLRLMQARLGRTLEDLRLVSQLASANYENTMEEAHELIRHLDKAIREIAEIYKVPYKTSLSDSLLPGRTKMLGAVNVIDVARAIAHIESAEYEAALLQLRAALNEDPR